jgi:hypothetical protein
MAASHYARICWNNEGWRRPAGVAKDGPNTFFGKYRFGFEEWLFDTSAEFDGWQYGFLQPVNRGYHGKIGQHLNVILYSIPGGSERDHRTEVEISNLEVLTPIQAETALRVFHERGRIDEMVAQVKAVKGDPSPLTQPNPYCESILNVRFRLTEVRKLPPDRPNLRADYYLLYRIRESVGPAEIDDTFADLPGVDLDSLGSDGAPRYEATRSGVKRDPKVRARVWKRSEGRCEVLKCRENRSYRSFLDVHHILGAEKSDRVWNCVALCPNCHRDAHFAADKTELNAALLKIAHEKSGRSL